MAQHPRARRPNPSLSSGIHLHERTAVLLTEVWRGAANTRRRFYKWWGEVLQTHGGV
jgi:hypothetical protein